MACRCETGSGVGPGRASRSSETRDDAAAGAIGNAASRGGIFHAAEAGDAPWPRSTACGCSELSRGCGTSTQAAAPPAFATREGRAVSTARPAAVQTDSASRAASSTRPITKSFCRPNPSGVNAEFRMQNSECGMEGSGDPPCLHILHSACCMLRYLYIPVHRGDDADVAQRLPAEVVVSASLAKPNSSGPRPASAAWTMSPVRWPP